MGYQQLQGQQTPPMLYYPPHGQQLQFLQQTDQQQRQLQQQDQLYQQMAQLRIKQPGQQQNYVNEVTPQQEQVDPSEGRQQVQKNPVQQ